MLHIPREVARLVVGVRSFIIFQIKIGCVSETADMFQTSPSDGLPLLKCVQGLLG